jgi:hypothetical protein
MKFYINVIVECLNITTHLLEMQVWKKEKQNYMPSLSWKFHFLYKFL